jgi:hypothetical protein
MLIDNLAQALKPATPCTIQHRGDATPINNESAIQQTSHPNGMRSVLAKDLQSLLIGPGETQWQISKGVMAFHFADGEQ